MASQDILNSMRSNRLFRGLELPELKSICHLVNKKTYQAGEFVIIQGELAKELFIVDNGAVEIMKRVEAGDTDYRMATLIDGDCVGEMTLFDNNPHSSRSASARALTTTTMLVILVEDLQSLVLSKGAQYHQLFINIAQELSMRLRRTNETAIDFFRYRLTEMDVTKISAGIKPPPRECADHDEIIKEIMFFREINAHGMIATITDDGMLPFYAPNDYVGGKSVQVKSINRLTGTNCIIQTNNNAMFVRHLRAGVNSNEVELVAINPLVNPRKIIIATEEIKSIAEIIWHRRTILSFK